jgi:hypothetical protein
VSAVGNRAQLTAEPSFAAGGETYSVQPLGDGGERSRVIQVPDADLTLVAVYGVDSDRDGLSDDSEVTAGTDPLSPDTDADGLSDGAEIFAHATDPLDPDSDGDIFGDATEITGGSDPNNPFSSPAPDGPVTLLDPPPFRENPALDSLPPLF